MPWPGPKLGEERGGGRGGSLEGGREREREGGLEIFFGQTKINHKIQPTVLSACPKKMVRFGSKSFFFFY